VKVLAAVAGKHILRGKHKYEPTPVAALWKGVKLNGHPQASPFIATVTYRDTFNPTIISRTNYHFSSISWTTANRILTLESVLRHLTSG